MNKENSKPTVWAAFLLKVSGNVWLYHLCNQFFLQIVTCCLYMTEPFTPNPVSHLLPMNLFRLCYNNSKQVFYGEKNKTFSMSFVTMSQLLEMIDDNMKQKIWSFSIFQGSNVDNILTSKPQRTELEACPSQRKGCPGFLLHSPTCFSSITGSPYVRLSQCLMREIGNKTIMSITTLGSFFYILNKPSWTLTAEHSVTVRHQCETSLRTSQRGGLQSLLGHWDPAGWHPASCISSRYPHKKDLMPSNIPKDNYY